MKEQKSHSFFEFVPKIAQDPIMVSLKKFNDSTNENKLNLTIGMIKDECGLNLKELKSVKSAESLILSENLNKDYTPMSGTPEFLSAIQNLIFPFDKFDPIESNILVMQTISGGGALRSGSELINKFITNKIYLSNLTFSPYKSIFRHLEVETYPYYNREKKELDFDALLSFLEKLEINSVINFQLSSHNPTATDPTQEQWQKVADVCSKKGLIPFFDIAYLGYANSSIEEDLFAIHLFKRKNVEMLIAYSSGKSFMNYSDDTGALLLTSKDRTKLAYIKSQLYEINRSLFLLSAIYGSRIITKILNDPKLKELWLNELKETWDSLVHKRNMIIDAFEKEEINNIDYLRKQKGVFMFFDLSPKQVDYLADSHAIFVVPGGRINISSLPLDKVTYFAKALKECLNN